MHGGDGQPKVGSNLSLRFEEFVNVSTIPVMESPMIHVMSTCMASDIIFRVFVGDFWVAQRLYILK